jgi:hypothetical protein
MSGALVKGFSSIFIGILKEKKNCSISTFSWLFAATEAIIQIRVLASPCLSIRLSDRMQLTTEPPNGF